MSRLGHSRHRAAASLKGPSDLPCDGAPRPPVLSGSKRGECGKGAPPATLRRPFCNASIVSQPSRKPAAAVPHTGAGRPALRCCTGHVSRLHWPYPLAPRPVRRGTGTPLQPRTAGARHWRWDRLLMAEQRGAAFIRCTRFMGLPSIFAAAPTPWLTLPTISWPPSLTVTFNASELSFSRNTRACARVGGCSSS